MVTGEIKKSQTENNRAKVYIRPISLSHLAQKRRTPVLQTIKFIIFHGAEIVQARTHDFPSMCTWQFPFCIIHKNLLAVFHTQLLWCIILPAGSFPTDDTTIICIFFSK